MQMATFLCPVRGGSRPSVDIPEENERIPVSRRSITHEMHSKLIFHGTRAYSPSPPFSFFAKEIFFFFFFFLPNVYLTGAIARKSQFTLRALPRALRITKGSRNVSLFSSERLESAHRSAAICNPIDFFLIIPPESRRRVVETRFSSTLCFFLPHVFPVAISSIASPSRSRRVAGHSRNTDGF